MKSRDFGFLITGAAFGLIGFGLLQSIQSGPERAPTIGGQEVPKENYNIDFTRRYNLILSRSEGDRSYENVKILGYTGKTVGESSGTVSGGYEHFGR